MIGAILLNLLLLVVGVVMLIRAGMTIVGALSAVARYLRFSEFLLSFVLLAFATSLPEIAVGIRSALAGIPELSLGDILGTNIVNLTLILGLVAVLGNGIELKDYKHFRDGRVFTFLFVIAPFLLLLDGTISRIDGIVLLVFFVVNITHILMEREQMMQKKSLRLHMQRHVHHTARSRRAFYKKLGLLAVGIPVLLLGAQLIVESMQNLSQLLGLPEFILGLFLISVGTSLPEMMIGIRSATVHKQGVSLGDLFGSAVMNSTLVLGLVAVIEPIQVPDLRVADGTGIFTAALLLLIFYFLRGKNSLHRREGILLLLVYVGFFILQLTWLSALSSHA